MDNTLHEMKLSAELDQLLTGLRNIAIAVATYRRELIEQGFTKPEAMRLASELQVAMLTARRNDTK